MIQIFTILVQYMLLYASIVSMQVLIELFCSLKYVSGWFLDCCRLLIAFQSKGLYFMHDMKSSIVGIMNLICALLKYFSAEHNTSPLSCITNFKHFSFIELIRVLFFNGRNFCYCNVIVYNYLIRQLFWNLYPLIYYLSWIWVKVNFSLTNLTNTLLL